MFNHHTSSTADDPINILETRLLDYKFRIRGPKEPTSKVGIISVDQKSIEEFGRYPFARKYYQQTFTNLKELGVKWVAFDIIFSEPERPLLEELVPTIEQLKNSGGSQTQALNTVNTVEKLMKASSSDLSLFRAIREFENVIMGYFYFSTEEEAKELRDDPFNDLQYILPSEIQNLIMPDGFDMESYSSLSVKGLVSNTPYLSGATEHFGYFSKGSFRTETVTRWVSLITMAKGHLLPSLSLLAAAKYLEREIVVFFDELGIEDLMLVNPDDDSDVINIPTDPTGEGNLLLNHLGPDKTIPHFSMVDIYNMNLTEEQKAALKDMVLIIGPTAIGLSDIRPNPFASALNGVENHAAIIDNIISQDFMQRPRHIFATELWILLAIGLIFSPILIYSRASLSGVVAVTFLTSYYFFDLYFWFNRGIWVYMATPMIQTMFLFIATTLYKYITEEREKRKVKGAFAHYLSPEVINQLLSDPDSLQLGGEKKELTVFFSDVRNFTSISENLTPEKLCEFMNDYFTPMTKIILDEKGVLDKFIGDAIMAFWGAPIEIQDAADKACEASIKMLYALDKIKADFRQRGFPDIDIGIGLNSGPMSVGNMGSNERFCYTVMGDSVNLGSRLEGLTKMYGVKIMISEYTYKNLTRKDFFIRNLDDIRVKGKLEPVRVYDLIRPDLLPSTALLKELIELFNQAREEYFNGELEQAKKKFSQVLKIRPEDGASEEYLNRIEKLLVNRPSEEWDGVWKYDHK